ncbi:thioredoxin family protein [Candidatus Bathyarchaeota archaeon]|nr:thioredoxin family protein [Candidatus Bathyarchaeota archaeon]
MELKVFTLPTCSVCPVAKIIAFKVAEEYDITCKIVDMATKEGINEGLAYKVMSAPSIAIDDDVIVRGHLISKERLEKEVKIRLEKWKARASE